MRTRDRSLLACVAFLLSLSVGAAAGQARLHQHYHNNNHLPKTASPSGALAPRLANLGPHTFPVTTKSPEAQRFINQGLNLTYGFNHQEASRAFAEAARLDPDAAMAYWGQALVLGPNINAAMPPEDEPKARALIQKAEALARKVSQRERDYIGALATRYTGTAENRAAADRNYARTMRILYETYPDDLDAATLYAEALMDLRPWDYWTHDGRPREPTEEIIAALDKVLARNPNHPGALHYSIHVWEASNTPERAQDAADRLLPLAPAAGHLVHMPGHIYQRVGRFADAVKANQLAIAADEQYITQCHAQGIYPLQYYPHNYHFLWFAATMAGQSKLAIDAARHTAESIPLETVQQMPVLQAFLFAQDFAWVRFGYWDEILAAGEPRLDTLYAHGIRHYARAMAFLRKNNINAARVEIRALRAIARDPQLIAEPTSMTLNNADSVLRVAVDVAAGEFAAALGRYDTAILLLDRAVRLHDGMAYTEPDDWHQPPRQVLAAVLLEAGRPAEAETVYWEDLRRNPKNGWSLFGLGQALRAQGNQEEAQRIDADFKQAWANADITLTSSRF